MKSFFINDHQTNKQLFLSDWLRFFFFSMHENIFRLGDFLFQSIERETIIRSEIRLEEISECKSFFDISQLIDFELQKTKDRRRIRRDEGSSILIQRISTTKLTCSTEIFVIASRAEQSFVDVSPLGNTNIHRGLDSFFSSRTSVTRSAYSSAHSSFVKWCH